MGYILVATLISEVYWDIYMYDKVEEFMARESKQVK